MDEAAAVLMMVNGVAIAGVWTRDILASDKVDLSEGVFAARDPDAGTLFWPHWLAEYATAIALIVAAAGLLADTGWAVALGGVATGALLYTGTNSLSWALAARDRLVYAIPMLVGVVTGIFLAIYLLTR
jgi:hypothetical protein